MCKGLENQMVSESKVEQLIEMSSKGAARIEPLLRDLAPHVQGCVLVYLLSDWLNRYFAPQDRYHILDQHIQLVLHVLKQFDTGNVTRRAH